ncbi:hypothetical protein [Pseudomonas sp. Irchel s3h14]|uniref:hypothetical protein n=1 Tax=Pseudomonas sp. Irchel s3h14 TaxID=2009179 RepID=UPI0015950822|nr:hypothetical protein [Pseudomonas sp. Irchel s3h14]
MQLDIWTRKAGIGFQKAAAFGEVADERTASMPDIVNQCLAHLRAAAQGDAYHWFFMSPGARRRQLLE